MKRNLATLLFIFLTTSIGSAYGQTIDDIINRHIEARGGLEKLKALQSLIMEGTMTQAGTEVSIKFLSINNKANKVEFSVMGQTGFTIMTRTEGWTFNPFAGNESPEQMPAEQVKDAQFQLDLQGPLVDYETKGNKVEYLGKESVQGIEYYKLKLTRSNGKTIIYWLDNNYLIAKTLSTVNVKGTDQEVTSGYSDYRKLPEGYTISFKRVTLSGEINFEKVQINPVIDEAVFKPSN